VALCKGIKRSRKYRNSLHTYIINIAKVVKKYNDWYIFPNKLQSQANI
jgi:hypothetical protein